MGRNRGFFAYFYAIKAEVFPDFVDLHKTKGWDREFFGTGVVPGNFGQKNNAL